MEGCGFIPSKVCNRCGRTVSLNEVDFELMVDLDDPDPICKNCSKDMMW